MAILIDGSALINFHGTMVQHRIERIIAAIIFILAIFLASVISTAIQIACTVVPNSSFSMCYIINSTFALNRQASAQINGNRIARLISQSLTIQIKCDILTLRDCYIFINIIQQRYGLTFPCNFNCCIDRLILLLANLRNVFYAIRCAAAIGRTISNIIRQRRRHHCCNHSEREQACQ